MSFYLRGGKGRTVDASYPVLVVVWWFRSGSSLPDYFSVRCSPEYPPWLFISPAKAKSTITFPNCSSPLLVFHPRIHQVTLYDCLLQWPPLDLSVSQSFTASRGCSVLAMVIIIN
jgi:hypothetical protein